MKKLVRLLLIFLFPLLFSSQETIEELQDNINHYESLLNSIKENDPDYRSSRLALSQIYQNMCRHFLEEKDFANWKKYSDKIYALFYHDENLAEMNQELEKSAHIALKYGLPDSLSYPLYTRIAYTENELRLYNKSIESFKKAYKSAHRKKDKTYRAKHILLPMSVAYAKLNDQNTAIRMQKQSIDFLETVPLTWELYLGYNNLGEYHYLNKEYESGLKMHRKIKHQSIFQDAYYHIANAHSGMAKIHLALANLDSAIFYNSSAISNLNAQKNWDDDQYELELEIIRVHAEIEEIIGNLEKAEIHYQNYLKKCLPFFNGMERESARSYNILAQFHERNLNYPKAKDLYQKALNQFENKLVDPQYLMAKAGKIRSAYYSNSLDRNTNSFLEGIKEALASYDQLRWVYKSDQHKQDLNQDIEELIDVALDIQFQNYTQTKSQASINEAMNLIERGRSNVLFEAMKKNMFLTQDTGQSSLNILALKNQLQWIESKLQDLERREEFDFYVRQKEDILLDIALLEDEVISKNLLNEIETNDIIKELNYDGFVLFRQSNEFIYRIVKKNDSIRFDRIEYDQKDLQQIKVFKSYFEFENRHEFKDEIAEELGSKYWPTALEPGSNILILPDGFLQTIPFEAFKKSDEFLVKNFNISYSNSLKAATFPKRELSKEAIAFAPLFSDDLSKILTYNLLEMKALKDDYSFEVLLGEDARESQFNISSNDYSIIHLSTHAWANSDSTDTPGIEFEDGILSLNELYHMNLNSNLVFLSACESNAGKALQGEGIISLNRGFNYAGIPASVSGLWKLDEKTTSHLTHTFYKELFDGKNISKSLKNAKKAYLYNPDIESQYKSPYYWAGLIHTGSNYELELSKKKDWNKIWITLFPIVIALMVILKKRKGRTS